MSKVKSFEKISNIFLEIWNEIRILKFSKCIHCNRNVILWKNHSTPGGPNPLNISIPLFDGKCPNCRNEIEEKNF